MKLSIKSFAAGVIIAAVGATAVFAAGAIKSVEYNANKVVFNGKEIDLKTSPMLSVVKEGETAFSNYMPLRAVLEAMGYEVGWDSETKTVLINSAAGSSSSVDKGIAKMLVGNWVYEDEYMRIRYFFAEDGSFARLIVDKAAEPNSSDFVTGGFTVKDGYYLSLEHGRDNVKASETSFGIGFDDRGESWSTGHGENIRKFVRDIDDTSWINEGSDTYRLGMPNPWNTCTEDEAFKHIGEKFKIVQPEGYKQSDIAVLAEPYAEAQGEAARFVYTNAKDEIYRVHINKGAAKGLINQGEPIKANGVDAYYNKEQSSVSYAAGKHMIIIDMPGKNKDELLKTVGSVTLAGKN